MKKKLTQLSDLQQVADQFSDEVEIEVKPKYRKEQSLKKKDASTHQYASSSSGTSERSSVSATTVKRTEEMSPNKKKGENTLYVKEFVDQESYQKSWEINKFQFREMVASKNRKWLLEEGEKAQFDYYKEYPEVYKKIEEMFEEQTKRKWLVHIITNFLPLNKSKQVPKLPLNRKTCPFTNFQLTDVKNIMVGDRDKHLAFTGDETNVVLSGVALQEFQRFVLDCTINFDTRAGHIVNYAIDALRNPKKD